MTEQSPQALDPPESPTQGKSRNPWKVVAVVLGVLIAVFAILAVIGSQLGDNRDEKLAEKLPASLEENFRDKGIDVTVSSVSCEDLPTSDGSFSIQCDVRIEGIDEVVEATVQGTATDDRIEVEEVFSEERLLTQAKAIEYVQGLVDEKAEGIAVVECDLGGEVVVIRPGSEFTCSLDSEEVVLITVAEDGSGSITDVFDMGDA